MASSETSFNSYAFTYKWKVNDLVTRLHNPSKLSSPTFSSPSGARPATEWMLTIFREGSTQTPPQPLSDQSFSVELARLVSTSGVNVTPVVATSSPRAPLTLGGFGSQFGGLKFPTSTPLLQTQNDDDEDVWVEAKLKLEPSSFGPNFGSASQGPTKLCLPKPNVSGLFGSPSLPVANNDASVITFKRFLTTFGVETSQSFVCEIKVWSLDKPIHVTKKLLLSSPESTNESHFSLSKYMEEARQNNLFTDVTLIVADRKEFKAHKVVLASQSQFFKTRFSNRWTDPRALGHADDRVEMTDVPAVIMEAILSYMYTGKVTDIGKIAHRLLPAAEEYGLVGLRKKCEKALIKLLTSTTAISMLIDAEAHNAPDLKKACMEFIVSNTATVRQSEGWSKLKETQMYRDLWMELLENIAEKHSVANSAGMPRPPKPRSPRF